MRPASLPVDTVATTHARMTHPLEYDVVHRGADAGAGTIGMDCVQPDLADRGLLVELD